MCRLVVVVIAFRRVARVRREPLDSHFSVLQFDRSQYWLGLPADLAFGELSHRLSRVTQHRVAVCVGDGQGDGHLLRLFRSSASHARCRPRGAGRRLDDNRCEGVPLTFGRVHVPRVLVDGMQVDESLRPRFLFEAFFYRVCSMKCAK